jgi:MYXO-CTERM domain-containing protein
VVAPAAATEGPGYGGTADELSVAWTTSDVQVLAMGAPGTSDLQIDGSPLSLELYGLGFRGRSEVSVSVGSSPAVTMRVDETGTLDLAVPVERLGAGPQPGTSVLVLGRAPSGTTRTLVGAVPPLPSGVGPAQIVPIGAAALALVGGAVAVRRRRRDGTPA